MGTSIPAKAVTPSATYKDYKATREKKGFRKEYLSGGYRNRLESLVSRLKDTPKKGDYVKSGGLDIEYIGLGAMNANAMIKEMEKEKDYIDKHVNALEQKIVKREKKSSKGIFAAAFKVVKVIFGLRVSTRALKQEHSSLQELSSNVASTIGLVEDKKAKGNDPYFKRMKENANRIKKHLEKTAGRTLTDEEFVREHNKGHVELLIEKNTKKMQDRIRLLNHTHHTPQKKVRSLKKLTPPSSPPPPPPEKDIGCEKHEVKPFSLLSDIQAIGENGHKLRAVKKGQEKRDEKSKHKTTEKKELTSQQQLVQRLALRNKVIKYDEIDDEADVFTPSIPKPEEKKIAPPLPPSPKRNKPPITAAGSLFGGRQADRMFKRAAATAAHQSILTKPERHDESDWSDSE
jgi:hypothetical protein